jgi:hypothetical protein
MLALTELKNIKPLKESHLEIYLVLKRDQLAMQIKNLLFTMQILYS